MKRLRKAAKESGNAPIGLPPLAPGPNWQCVADWRGLAQQRVYPLAHLQRARVAVLAPHLPPTGWPLYFKALDRLPTAVNAAILARIAGPIIAPETTIRPAPSGK